MNGCFQRALRVVLVFGKVGVDLRVVAERFDLLLLGLLLDLLRLALLVFLLNLFLFRLFVVLLVGLGLFLLYDFLDLVFGGLLDNAALGLVVVPGVEDLLRHA